MSDLPQAAAPRPAVAVSRPRTTGDTVTVACKLPQGVMLRVFDWEEYDDPQRDGSIRRVKRSLPIPGMEFVVRGTWVGSAGQAYHRNNPSVAELLPGGYALTPGCPKEIWDRWFDQNKKSHLVVNKIIFAHANHTTVHQSAVELRAVQTSMEPLNPANPAERMPGVDRRLRMSILERGAEDTSPS